MKYTPTITALFKYVSAFRDSDDPSLWEAFLFPFISALLVGLFVYCLPVLIYRFLVRDGRPLESKWKATWVGWVFWVCSYIVICVFYLATGNYENEGFSVRPGIPDLICLVLNCIILYYSKQKSNVRTATPRTSPVRKCLKCGSVLPQGARFCKDCGEKVPSSLLSVCPECGNTVVIGKYCSVCGHCFDKTPDPSPSSKLENVMNSQYSKSEMDQIVYQEMKKKDDDNSTRQAIALCIVVGILALFLIFIYVIGR